jgi:hypothetical protein
MALGQSTPSKWIDQSTPSNCNLTYFASCFIQTVDEVRVSGISPLCRPVPPPVSSRARSPRKETSKATTPTVFLNSSHKFLKYDSIGAFSVFGRAKKTDEESNHVINGTNKIVDDEIMKVCNALITKNKPQKEEEDEETIAV